MLLYAITCILALLLALLYVTSRSFLSPPMLFVGMWTVTLGTLAVVQDSFYAVSLKTLTIYLVGALAFSAGGLAVMCALPREFAHYKMPEARHRTARMLLDIALVVVLVAFPFFVRYVTEPIGGLGAENLLTLIRMVNLESGRSAGFNPMSNLPILARFVAYGLVVENDGTKWRRARVYLAGILAVLYGLLTGSKEILVTILIVPFFIEAIKKRRLDLRKVVALGAIVLVFFAGGLLLINYWWQASYTAVVDLLPDIAWTAERYWLAGPVAFDQVVQHPSAMESRQNASRIFISTANSFGAKLYLPDLASDFTQVSPREEMAEMNVYTIYVSYFKDPGWLGMIALMLLVGAANTLVYKLALTGRPIAIVLYGLLAEATILSFNGEHYFFGLNQFAKLVIFLAIIYHFPVMFSRRQPRTPGPA